MFVSKLARSSRLFCQPFLLSRRRWPAAAVATLRESKYFSLSAPSSAASDKTTGTEDEPLFEDSSEEAAFGRSFNEVVDLDTHSTMLQEYNLRALDTQRVLVIQPHYHSGGQVRPDTRKEYILEETMGLIDTLGWTVVDAITVTIRDENWSFFGPGQLDNIRDYIDKIENPVGNEHNGADEATNSGGAFISAIFISTVRLNPAQLRQIEEVVGKPVLDRYNIILQIFKRHAVSPESKLQVKLAELPYLKSRLIGDHESEMLMKHSKQRKGEDFFDKQRASLARREKSLKQEIGRLTQQRDRIRQQRRKRDIPSVAIVGYTNAGKTSLIKALTKEDRLQPLNKLFATLDVTVHAFELPSNIKTLFVDTIGFISDIPTELIASFNSTLEDAVQADVLIHVRDMSNPDHFAQSENVLETLEKINVPRHLMESMIVVGNKIDRLAPEDWQLIKDDGIIPVSCKVGYGLNYLVRKIDNAVIKAKGKQSMVIKVPIAEGLELDWLKKNTSVTRVEINPEDSAYWNVNVLITDVEFSRFKKAFLGKQKSCP